VIGLFQHDARGGDTFLDTRPGIDDVGKPRRPGQFAINECGHQFHQFSAIARRHVGWIAQNPARGQIAFDAHVFGHLPGSFGYWS